MEALCMYYNNIKRLALVLERLLKRNDITVYPVRGTFVHGHKTVRCLGDLQEFLVLSNKGETPVLLTSNPEFSAKSQNVIDYIPTVRDNIYVQALNLCKDKFSTSNNPFTMECALKGHTVVASAKSGELLNYAVKTPVGELLRVSSTIPVDLYTDCQSIKLFRYSVVTNACEKEVTVKTGQVEVFREIAHYISKAIVFTKMDGNSVVKVSAITANGCCELRQNKRGQQYIGKVPFTKMKVDPESAIYAIDCSFDALLRASNFSTIFAGGEVFAED